MIPCRKVARSERILAPSTHMTCLRRNPQPYSNHSTACCRIPTSPLPTCAGTAPPYRTIPPSPLHQAPSLRQESSTARAHPAGPVHASHPYTGRRRRAEDQAATCDTLTDDHLLVDLGLHIAVAIDFVVGAECHRHVRAHSNGHLGRVANVGVQRSRQSCTGRYIGTGMQALDQNMMPRMTSGKKGTEAGSC